MNTWPDAKRFVFEDLIVYSILCLICLLWDFGIYIGNYFGLGILFSGETIHPLRFGLFQFLGLVLFSVLLVISIARWRYHK